MFPKSQTIQKEIYHEAKGRKKRIGKQTYHNKEIQTRGVYQLPQQMPCSTSQLFHSLPTDICHQYSSLLPLNVMRSRRLSYLAVVRSSKIIKRMRLCRSMVGNGKCSFSQLLHQKVLTSKEKVISQVIQSHCTKRVYFKCPLHLFHSISDSTSCHGGYTPQWNYSNVSENMTC